jgi:hypothetical protein
VADKRDNYRHKKRLPVKFGVGEVMASGFTEDISNYGLFVKAGVVHAPGRELIVELSLPSGLPVKLVVKVEWAKKIPQAMLRTHKGGMGFTILRFLEGEEAYGAFCDELHKILMERNSYSKKTISSPEEVMRED